MIIHTALLQHHNSVLYFTSFEALKNNTIN